MLRAGEVNEEAEDRADMRPIGEVFAARGALAADAECRQQRRDLAAHRPPRRRRVMAGGNGERGLEQHSEHDSDDEKIDERGVERVRAAEARRPDDVALPDGEAEADQNDDGEYVLKAGDPGIAADRRQAEAGKEARAEGLDDRREQHDETAEDHGMEDAGIADLQQALVESNRAQHADDAFARAVEARVGTRPQQRTKQPIEAPCRDGARERHERPEDGRLNRH